MAELVRTTFKQRLQMAGAIVGTLLTMNTIFWIGSSFYYDDKPSAADNPMVAAQIAFAALSMLVAGASYVAVLAPRLIGHALAGVMAVASVVGGIAALAKGMAPVMGITMLVVGGLLPVLIWKSLLYSRAAWAFLIAMVATFCAVCFFGAPKVRNLLGIGLWYALIIPGLQIVSVISLSMLRGEYRD